MSRTANMPDAVSIALSKLDAFFEKAFIASIYFAVVFDAAIVLVVFGSLILNILGIPNPLFA